MTIPMHATTRRLARRSMIYFSAAVVAVACAAGPKSDTGPRTRNDPSRMDSTELMGHNYSTVYDAVLAAHADWLVPRGGGISPMGDAPTVGVYVEGQMRNLTVSYLRGIRPIEVKGIRHMTTSESLGSFGWPWGAIVIIPR